jgi:hypothetical protein
LLFLLHCWLIGSLLNWCIVGLSWCQRHFAWLCTSLISTCPWRMYQERSKWSFLAKCHADSMHAWGNMGFTGRVSHNWCYLLYASKHAIFILCLTYTKLQSLQAKDLLCLSTNAFTREKDIKEKAIQDKHKSLTVPTMYMFFAWYLKAVKGDKEVYLSTISYALAPHFLCTLPCNQQFLFPHFRCSLRTFYSELVLVECKLLIYLPLVTAVATVYAARRYFKWIHVTGILEYHTNLIDSKRVLFKWIHVTGILEYHTGLTDSKGLLLIN